MFLLVVMQVDPDNPGGEAGRGKIFQVARQVEKIIKMFMLAHSLFSRAG